LSFVCKFYHLIGTGDINVWENISNICVFCEVRKVTLDISAIQTKNGR